ncbi:hypothetical protein [Dactylosporangium sp. CA-233914]|uniref:hypothetical protein n=1 Tax=Dactylosporangium sp. CA-233914 TaxID=3239934 RepID=UPI003D8EF9F7
MINTVEKLGLRLLARLVPQTEAKAFCIPQWLCSYCGSGPRYRSVYQNADCSYSDYGFCSAC